MLAGQRGTARITDDEGERSVANLTVGFGIVLIALGVGTFVFVGANVEQWTALIPAFFGAVLGFCGVLARKDRLRMHVMHLAVLVGLAGCVMGWVRVGPHLGELFTTGRVMHDGKDKTVASIETLALAVICTIFTALCIRSFINVRRARRAQQATS
jgi:hypothetical protein